MPNLEQDPLLDMFRGLKTIAVVGLSPKPDRASFRVTSYMQKAGYRIIPIRPGGGKILGETCYDSLADLPEGLKIDLVDVFRRSEDTPPIAQAAVAIGARGFWLQSGILNDQAMALVRAAGLVGVQDRCLMVEHRRLAHLL